MRPNALPALAALLLLVMVPAASVQTLTTPTRPPAFTPPPGLGALAPAPSPAPLLVAPAPATAPSVRIGQGGRREAVALMIVGGAGILTGLLIDEDIVTIAGAGVAGVGLFLYLR